MLFEGGAILLVIAGFDPTIYWGECAMAWLGMLMLGSFIGFILAYGLKQITDWKKPANVFSAVTSAAVSGAVFTFIQFLGAEKLGQALFLYPVGLAYGALCANLRWVTDKDADRTIVFLHIIGFVIASFLLGALLLSERFRLLLPP